MCHISHIARDIHLSQYISACFYFGIHVFANVVFGRVNFENIMDDHYIGKSFYICVLSYVQI